MTVFRSKVWKKNGMCQAAYDCDHTKGMIYNPNTLHPFAKNQCLCHNDSVYNICESSVKMDIGQCQPPNSSALCEATARSHGLTFGGDFPATSVFPTGCWLSGNFERPSVVFNPPTDGGSNLTCAKYLPCQGHICADNCPADGDLEEALEENCKTTAGKYNISFEKIENPEQPNGCSMDYDLNKVFYNEAQTEIVCVGACSRYLCTRPKEKAFCDTDGECKNVKQRNPPCVFVDGKIYNSEECSCGGDNCKSAIKTDQLLCKKRPMTLEDCKTATEIAGVFFLGVIDKDFNYTESQRARSMANCSLAEMYVAGKYVIVGIWNPNKDSTAVCGESSVCAGHLCMEENCKKLPQTKDGCENFAKINGLDFDRKTVSEDIGKGLNGCVFEPYYKNLDKVRKPWILWYDNDYQVLVCGEDDTKSACVHRTYCSPPKEKAFCNSVHEVCSNVWNPSCTGDTTVQIEPGEECPNGYEDISSEKDCAKFTEQTEIMTVEYSLRETGTCSDPTETIITDNEECMLAAVELGKSKDFATVEIVNNVESPPGCLFSNNWGTEKAPQLNNGGDQNCGANGYNCICKKLTVSQDKTYTYGNSFSSTSYNDGCLLVNNKSFYNVLMHTYAKSHYTRRLCAVEPRLEGCQCGKNVCRTDARFCENQQCTQEKVCNHIYGKIKNSEIDCECGKTMCNTTTGFFCLGSESRCVKVPSCANTNGQEPNEQCVCGDNTCDSGDYCYAGFNHCSQKKDKVNSTDICSMDHLEENANECYCGSKICNATKYCVHSESSCLDKPNNQQCVENKPLNECMCNEEFCPIKGKALCNSTGKCEFPPICTKSTAVSNDFCRCAPASYGSSSYAYNPCPASHPFLEKHSNTSVYKCYKKAGNVDPCDMTNSTAEPPLDGSWGTAHVDCNMTKLAEAAGKGSPLFEHCDRGMYCGKSTNSGHLRCTANRICDIEVNKTTDACSCEINGEFVTCVTGQYCNSAVGKCTDEIPCQHTDGSVSDGACACSSDICRDNQYCHNDTCKDYPMCTDMTGKNRTGSGCGCGSSQSNMFCFTGQYCHENSCENEPFCLADGENNTCICSPQAKETIIQPTTYWQGCLPSPDGQNVPTFKGPVYQDLTKDDCEGIASIYDYTFVEIPAGDGAASKPRFCSVVNSIVYYNANYSVDGWFSNNNERCNTGNETCLCKTDNPEQKVICSKEESCIPELKQCSISVKFGEELSDIAWPDNPNMYGPCANDDIILNGQTCLCGSTFCKGKKCSGHDGANATCEFPADCQKGMNSKGCRCGAEICVRETGLYCHTDREQHRCSQDLCEQTDGTKNNTEECACGIADCQADQYCNSSKSECSSVNICDTSEVPIDGECRCGSSQETCNIGQYCYTGLEKCVSEPPCANQNGLEQNDNTCYCKTALCNASQYCSGHLEECSSHGIFSGSPVCQIQDQTAENEVPECWCGSNECSNTTGMVCDYSKSECSHFTCNTQTLYSCQCGDHVCVASSGFQCSSDSKCEFAPECEYLYGEGKNKANCKCSDIECNRKEPYCHRVYGCSTTPEWQSPPISACEYIDEEQPNMNECLCGTNICGDKNLCKASENNCTSILDCMYQQPLLLNNGKSCRCDSDGLFCHKGSAICDPTAGICDRLDQCEFSNNNTENSRACTCGLETCTQSSGLICDGSSCYKHEPCLNELPFELNERACQCGETTCDNYSHCSNLCQSGSYCSTKFEHCSDGPGFRGYIPKVDGDCPALDTESILNETMNVTSAQTILSVYGQQIFVSFGNNCSSSSCTGGELPTPAPIQVNEVDEWCAYAPVCAQTDGINPNDGSCACRGISYCHEYQKYCSTGCHENPKCPFTSGISLNKQPCACGQNLSPCDKENPFCIKDLNGGTCYNSTICSKTDGLMKTSEDCFCGENKVHCSSGLYCIASKANGTCLPEEPCQNMDGSEQNSEKCRCGSVGNKCDPDQYCFHDDDNSICDNDPIQICDSKEGFIISTEACHCGGEKCDGTQYCHKDSVNQCRDSPRCLYYEGKLQNIEGCDCSDVKTANKKLYCYEPGRVSQYPNEVKKADGDYIQKCDLSGQKKPESEECLCGISKECSDEYCIGGIPFDGDNIGYLYSCEQFKNELGPSAGENTGTTLVNHCQEGYDTNTCNYDQPEQNACDWGKKLKEHHLFNVTCDNKPACGDYTRSKTNPSECWCGAGECTTGSGLACSALNGGKCGHPLCSDTLALENIDEKCSCSPNKKNFLEFNCVPKVGVRQLCYYPDDMKCENVDDNYPECGCTTKSLYKCKYNDGLLRNMDTMGDICVCGETVCKPGQYCNAEFSMCGDTTIQSCDHQDGLRANPTSCLCGPEQCGSGGLYCNPKRVCEDAGSCFCHKKLCSDFQDPDSLCDFEGYGAGLVSGKECAGTTCTADDLKTCCRVCGDEFRVIDGVCTHECTPTISVDDKSIPLCQTGWFFPTVSDWKVTQIKKDASYIAFLSRMSADYSGYCSSKTCSADDQYLCCLPAQQCSTQDPYNLCVGGNYTGEFTDPDAYCTGIDCEARDCCAELSCTCENGSPAVGRQCPQVGSPKCIACNTEYWLNGFQCVAATTCEQTEWESIPLGTRNDRRCTDIRTCHDIQYQTVAPDNTTNRECERLTVCNETQYISKEKETDTNNAISNRECEDMIECKENEYETKTPTNTSDGQYKENRECALMTATCDQNHYESQSPTVNRNRRCSPYNVTCSENEFESSSRNETSDRQCQTLTDCDLETQFIAQEKNTTTDRICQTNCQSYEYEFEEKTEITAVRKCRTISNCSSGFFIATDYTNTSDRLCKAWKTCNVNEYESKGATRTNDRECEECVPAPWLENWQATCLGCRLETDCAFNPESLVSDRKKCAGITCKRHILDTDYADIIVKVDTWIRFESKPNETYKFESSGVIGDETINTDLNYRYFQVVSSDGFIKINGTELKIQQDCTFNEYKWQGCSVRCGTGQELGFRGQKLMDAKHGGAACGDTPKTTFRPCQGQFCPQNCEIEWETAQGMPKFGPCNATCGEEGLQYRNYTIIEEPKNGGNECPTILQQRECVGTDPGYCDCKKNVLDQCQVCGGNGDTCLGCDNVPNSGYEWNACGECMPKGAACSPQAHSKFTKLTKKQEKSKKTKTIITKTFVPIIAGILLFVSAVIGIAVYISKRDQKTDDREIREIFLA